MRKAEFCLQATTFLSKPRIDAYRLTPADDDIEAFARYSWNVALCSAIYPAIESFEVCFRNAIYLSVAARLNNRRWLVDGSVLKGLDNDAIQAEIANLETLRARFRPAAAVVDRNTVRIDDLIPKLTLGFWCRLLKNEYELDIAIPCLDTGGHLHRLSSAVRGHSQLKYRVGHIRDLRNRIAHHEPIWKPEHRAEQTYRLMVRHTALISPANGLMGRGIDYFPTVLNAGHAPYRAKIEGMIV